MKYHMNYKVTEHYARGEEKLIAEFNVLYQARIFMTKKVSIDDEEEKQIIYRVYGDNELLHVLNQANISTAYAKYAEGNGDFNNAARFIFNVKINTADSLESEIIAQFYNKNDANLFVVCLFDDKNIVHDNDLFLIYEGKYLIDTANKITIDARKKASSTSGGNNQDSAYTLSPLSMRPTPRGGPADYWVEKKDDDEK